MSDMEWAVRVAKAELERDAVKQQLDMAHQALRDIQNNKGFTLFGHPPEFWLHLKHEMGTIANECWSDDIAMEASITGRGAYRLVAERALRWDPDRAETAHETAHDPAETQA